MTSNHRSKKADENYSRSKDTASVGDELDALFNETGQSEDPSRLVKPAARKRSSADSRKEAIKRFHIQVSEICARNGVSTAGVYPFLVKVVTKFGLIAVEEGIRAARDLSRDRPERLIYTQAEDWFEEYGRDDESYLEALAAEGTSLDPEQPMKPQHKPAAHEAFAADLLKPFTTVHYRSVTRMMYCEIVRDFCREHPQTYDYRKLYDYFTELIASDPRRHARIEGPNDVPAIDFEYLKASE